MADSTTEEFEPLFDYGRVQPRITFVCLDDNDDCSDSKPVLSPKRRKKFRTAVEKEEKNEKVIDIVDCDQKEEEDWLLPPPKDSANTQKLEDSTLKELRLKKQELVSFAQSAEDVMRAVEESVKRELCSSVEFSLESGEKQQLKPPFERAKVIISLQDEEGPKRFVVFMDDKFERIFKMYADKAKLDLQSLTFCFDGDKISSTATPGSLGMEDEDIIEVRSKSS